MREMRAVARNGVVILAAALAVCLLAPRAARAQGSRKDDIVLNARGLPLAGATVRVCATPASGQPCTPLALIYSDAALTQALANPTATDGMGNYTFYAAPGKYLIEISGPGITTRQMNNVILPSDPTSPSFSSVSSSGAISAFSLSLGGNLSVGGSAAVTGAANLSGGGALAGTFSGNPAFSGTVTLSASGNAQLKPAAGDSVRYVSTTGNDANDGLSWGTAKLTMYGALVSLPGGLASPPTAGTGTVYFSDGASANPTSGAGIWLMAGTDPNYASPPAGWLRSSGSVSIIGVPKQAYGSITHTNRAALAAGSSADLNHPAVWLSGTQGAVYIANASFVYPKRGVVVGECSNNTRTGTCGVSDVTFDNVNVAVCNGCAAGNGPSFDVTGGSFWLWFRDITAQGTEVQNGNSSNLSPGFLFDGAGNTGVGYIHMRDIQIGGGGIKLIPGTSGVGLTRIENVSREGNFVSAGMPAVWYASTSCSSSGPVMLANISVADSIATTPAVQNDCTNGNWLTVNGAYGAGKAVVGPAVVLSQYPTTLNNLTVSPRQEGQTGFFNGRVFGQADASRRAFSPAAVRFANIAPQTNTSWTIVNGTATVTNNVTGPNGVANAMRAVYLTGTPSIQFYRANRTYAVGDYLIGGLWARRPAASGLLAGTLTLQIVSGGFTLTGSPIVQMPWTGDGEWEWLWNIQKVTSGSGLGDTVFSATLSSTNSVEAYAPIFLHIPAGTVSDNEAYELAAQLSTYPDTASAGDVAMLRGQRLNLMGNALTGVGASGTTLSRYARYAVTLSPALVAANTCAAQSFTVTGIAAGDILIAMNKPTEQAGLSVTPGHVTAANTATLNFCNHTGAGITPTAGESYNFVVVQ